MTPPDSGERCPWSGYTDNNLSGQCSLRRGHGGPHEIARPDSGERGVQHVVAAAFEYCRVDGEVAVHVSLPLAQRILAALDAAASDYERLKLYGATPVREIAVELRAVMPKGTR